MRYAHWVAFGLGLSSVACVLFPLLAVRSEVRAYALYTIAAGMAILASTLALVLASLLLFGKGRRIRLLVCAVSLIAAAYSILYVVVAFHERERSWSLVSCAVRLTQIHAQVSSYYRIHGELPERIEDLGLPKQLGTCPSSHETYLLWPNGIPKDVPLPPTFLVACEATPAHLSLWFAPIAPLPHPWKYTEHVSLLDYPEEKRERYARDRAMLINVPCNGPLTIDADGAVRIPGGAYLSF
jgi:hypothetical protein